MPEQKREGGYLDEFWKGLAKLEEGLARDAELLGVKPERPLLTLIQGGAEEGTDDA